MKSNDIYNKAKQNGITLECTCVGMSERKWDSLMEGATRADKRIVDKLVLEADPSFTPFIKYYNPYNHFKTKTHLIFVHSCIEHFFKIN
jgi:hypothetical protein